jgi:RsiW-degrading membrane proteinase PrsW (M82 family)
VNPNPLVLLGVLLSVALSAILPALALALLVRWMDRYEREPLWIVLLAFLGGMIGSAVFSLVVGLPAQWFLSFHLGKETSAILSTIFSAPLIEEIGKLAIVLGIGRTRAFDGPVDGIVYGAVVGLGFGATENILYFLNSLRGGVIVFVVTLIIRTCYTLLLHMLCTATSGLALGLAWMGEQSYLRRHLIVGAGLLAAMGMHFLGNILAVQSKLQGIPALLLVNMTGCFFFLGILFLIFQLELLKEAEILQEELQEEVTLGILSPEGMTLLTTYRERLSTSLRLLATLHWFRAWHLHRLSQTAGQLALKKYRIRAVTGAYEENQEIRNLRIAARKQAQAGGWGGKEADQNLAPDAAAPGDSEAK